MGNSTSGGRRRFLKRAGAGIIAVGVSRVFGNDWQALAAAMEKEVTANFPNLPGMPPEVTPNDRFYEVSKNWFSNPSLDADAWRLKVAGLVRKPVTLTYAELQELPAVEEYATLKCIGDPVDGKAMGNALWKGVRLRDLFEGAGGADPKATELILRAADDYSDSFPMDKALADGTILAYRMNGAPLPKDHGFPARVIVPGIYGMKNVKWLTALEPADYDYKGYWEKKGWSDVARYHTISRVDVSEDEALGRKGRVRRRGGLRRGPRHPQGRGKHRRRRRLEGSAAEARPLPLQLGSVGLALGGPEAGLLPRDRAGYRRHRRSPADEGAPGFSRRRFGARRGRSGGGVGAAPVAGAKTGRPRPAPASRPSRLRVRSSSPNFRRTSAP